ncbi:MAG: type II toxin-antitoxin system prevent-host-death family antitoxin [Aquihabitans sp.]
MSKYIDLVRAGEEVIVTDRGRPVARLLPLDASHDLLGELVAPGVVRPPSNKARHQSPSRIKPEGSVSEIVAEQRR